MTALAGTLDSYVVEPAAQLRQSEPHPALDGAGRQGESVRDLLVGESAIEAEPDHLALRRFRHTYRQPNGGRSHGPLDSINFIHGAQSFRLTGQAPLCEDSVRLPWGARVGMARLAA
jgi:hypothetical protein